MKSYGGIDPNVLDLELSSIDENYVTLKEMIDEEISEPIVAAQYTTETNYKDEMIIQTLTIWTDEHLYMLIYAHIGYCFVKSRRNPEAIHVQ